MRPLKLMATILLVVFFLFLYAMACYYIGIKGMNIFPYKNNRVKVIIYWIIFWILSGSYIISILCRNFLSVNSVFTSIFTSIGAVWLAIFFYLMILFPLTDLVKFIFCKTGLKGEGITYLSKLYGNGILIFVIVFIIVSFGVWNAIHPRVTNYNINIDKNAGKINSLNIVMVSDVHAGIGVKQNGIDNMISSINSLKPDIIFFCGDMVDESTSSKLKQYLGASSKNIKSKYGVYSITGNHEYIQANLPETISYLKSGNVKTLEDTAVKIDNSFYVVGRNDPASVSITKKQVKPLKEVLESVDKSLPVIVLNHQPIGLEEAEKEKVDLQLSGHTHKGQFFPNNFITKLVYEDDYGYLKKGDFNLIVSSGYGTWGPPIRIGTKGEIVKIKVNFH
ncbi:metallophosphoesterase [Clostridium arbusti]|uniref:metallophosphoesterase n=1 Tax=Clostridium arbusti TaxID=1137848 RepID=UPI00028939BA|nr:metallophosphoesterase [Clostridium arbusti]